MKGKEFKTTCCIAGDGSAEMMIRFLLARSGIDVIALEIHPPVKY